MLIIVLHHHIVHNQFNPVGTGWSQKQLAYVFLAPSEKVGFVIFWHIRVVPLRIKVAHC